MSRHTGIATVNSEAQQAATMAYRIRDLLVRQRTPTIIAVWVHLTWQGIIAPICHAHVGRPVAVVDGAGGGAGPGTLAFGPDRRSKREDRGLGGHRAAPACRHKRYCAAASCHFEHCCDHRSDNPDFRAVDGDIFEKGAISRHGLA